MENIKGKKILILGGTTLLIHVVNTAKEMGCITIVTDMDPESPAKKFSDKSYNISTGDIDALVELANKERIDGVFTGYEDFNTSVACQLCQRLNLPFYATQEQIDITKNKIIFKETCKRFDIPVVKEYCDDNIFFPCVTKPADSYSGKGILICNNLAEYAYGKEFAKSFSKTDQYLVEKFMDSHSVECINIDYLIRDGEVKLSAVGDKFVNDEQGNKTPLTAAVVYPSKRKDEYERTLDRKVVEMFTSLGMKNGTLFIESFYDEEGFHFYEMGYRVGGGQSSILLDKINGVDYVKMLINFALTGKMCDEKDWNRVTPDFDKYACGLVVLIKPGIITKIEGLDQLESFDDIVKITQYYQIGDSVQEKLVGTLGQTFARIHIVSNNVSSFLYMLNSINSTLKILDENGENLLLSVVCQKFKKHLNNLK